MSPESSGSKGPSRYYDAAAVLVLIASSVVMLLTWRDYGISWDEAPHLAYGEHIYAFYSSGFEDQSALSYRIDYLYGGGYDLLGAVFREWLDPPLDRWDAIHLFGALVTVVGFWGTWKLGRALGGPRAGLLAALFIAATSVYWGHAVNNPKDLPFAVAYVWAMAFLVEAIRSFPRVPRSLVVKLAVAVGLAMSVRIAGLLLLCYLAGAMAVWVAYHGWLRRSAEAGYRYARRLAATGLGVAGGAWLVMLVFWPWAMYDPLARPFAALRVMSGYTVIEREMPFAGEMISSYEVDWRYMPHYFGLKLPEFIVVLFVLGTVVGLAALVWRARRIRCFTDNLILGTLLVSLFFPWVYALYKHSPLYDGLRHFLFEVPVVVASAAWFVSVLIGALAERVHRWATPVALSCMAALCVDQYATIARMHPHEYVYFNRFIGGLAGAVGNYSTDYYSTAYADAGREFANQLWKEEPETFLNTTYRMKGCAHKSRMLRKMPPNFIYTRRNFDFWMAYTRANCHERHDKFPVIYELTREGGMLILVRDIRGLRERQRARRRAKRLRERKRRRATPKPAPRPPSPSSLSSEDQP